MRRLLSSTNQPNLIDPKDITAQRQASNYKALSRFIHCVKISDV